MVRYSSGNMESNRAIAQGTKEALKPKLTDEKIKAANKLNKIRSKNCEPGLKNCCNFGKHNIHFDETKSI